MDRAQRNFTRTLQAASAALSAQRHQPALLLVEDQSDVRRVTQRILEEAGYEVIIAGNGEEGLERWRRHHGHDGQVIDCVVTDVVMPGLSGSAMAQAMRAIDARQPVLFMSGYVEDELSEEDLAGHTAFLAKPFTSEALLTAVNALLNRVQS